MGVENVHNYTFDTKHQKPKKRRQEDDLTPRLRIWSSKIHVLFSLGGTILGIKVNKIINKVINL